MTKIHNYKMCELCRNITDDLIESGGKKVCHRCESFKNEFIRRLIEGTGRGRPVGLFGKRKTIWQKITCFIFGHKWKYTISLLQGPIDPECIRCGRVGFVPRKPTLGPKPPPKKVVSPLPWPDPPE